MPYPTDVGFPAATDLSSDFAIGFASVAELTNGDRRESALNQYFTYCLKWTFLVSINNTGVTELSGVALLADAREERIPVEAFAVVARVAEAVILIFHER